MLDNETVCQGILIDLDGVIYQSDHLIAGTVDALAWIRQQQIPHLFVTNTTSRSRRALLEKFETLGFSAQLDEVMTPVVAATQWLDQHQLRSAALFVPSGTKQDFADIQSIPLESDAAVDAVVIGDLGEAWDFRLLNCAFRFLMQDPGPQLIALGMTRYWRARDGLQLDVAPFVKALEHAASCEAVVVGKPAAAFFDSSLARLGCGAAQTFMIGDDIVGDIDAAQRCGIRGIQVRTGKFRETDLDSTIKPYALLDSFADLPAWWAQTVTNS
jgi:HAD superfamily hydrolase (TIGR01458 family)